MPTPFSPPPNIRVFSRIGGLALDLEWIGEGHDGDYDEGDPGDTPLMRFTLLRRGPGAPEEVRAHEQVEDASYCTRIPATLPEPQLRDLATWLLGQFEAAFDGSPHESYRPKRLAERLSWCDADKSILPDLAAHGLA